MKAVPGTDTIFILRLYMFLLCIFVTLSIDCNVKEIIKAKFMIHIEMYKCKYSSSVFLSVETSIILLSQNRWKF